MSVCVHEHLLFKSAVHAMHADHTSFKILELIGKEAFLLNTFYYLAQLRMSGPLVTVQ